MGRSQRRGDARMGSNDAKVVGPGAERYDEVLTPDAIAFVTDLQRQFGATREELLARRKQRRQQAADTGKLDFLDETKDVREDTSWRVAEPAGLPDRRGDHLQPPRARKLLHAPHHPVPGLFAVRAGA